MRGQQAMVTIMNQQIGRQWESQEGDQSLMQETVGEAEAEQ